MQNKLKKIFFPVFLLSLPLIGFAGTGPSATLSNPIRFNDINSFLLEMLKVIVQYGALLIVFFIIFAGFKFVVAQGNSEKINEAKQMLVWVIVGAFVLLGVFVIRAAICGTLSNLGVAIQCT